MPHLQKLLTVIKTKKFQIIILIVIVFLAYGNTLQNDFAWDDHDFIFYWPSIKDNGNLSATLSLPSLLAGDLPLNHLGVYRPIRSIFYLLSFKLWDTNPFGYHLQSIIIQTIAVLLVYSITRLIMNKPFVPFMAATLFATHPMHTESIAFVTASFDTIGIVFLFVSFYFYLRAEISKTQLIANRIASYIYSFLAFFTYEMTLVLPLLVILYDFCFKKLTIKNWRTRFKIYIPYFTLLLAYGSIRFSLLRIGNRDDYLGSDFLKSAILGRIEAPEMILQYFSWLVFPVNLTIGHKPPDHFLSAMVVMNNYSYKASQLINLLTRTDVVIPIASIAISTIIILKIFSKRKEVAFGISWFLVSLLTVSNVVPQGTVWAERFLYLPSFGFSLLSAYLYYTLYALAVKSNYRKLFSYLIITFFVLNISFYLTTTFLRNREWKNDQTLFLSVLKINPNDYLALNGLGLFYLKENRVDLAIENFKKALALTPTNATYHFNLALAYEKKGNINLAILEYKKGLEIKPNENYMRNKLDYLIKLGE